jgi:hypothetical protein
MFDVLRLVPKSKDWSKDNVELERTIELIRSAYPQMFLQPHELKYRKFVSEPGMNIPYESCVYPIQPVAPPKPAKKVRNDYK